MTALASYRYRDPIDVLLRDEARTCRGCVHQIHNLAFGVIVTSCAKRRRHGKRCQYHKEVE